MKKNTEFDYGEAVRVRVSAAPEKRPGQIGSICGFRVVVPHPSSGGPAVEREITLVLVEFSGGESVEIEGDLLEKP